MPIQVFAILGVSRDAKLEALAEVKNIDIFDFQDELDKLLEVGQEACRQVGNYFGDEFLKKDGSLRAKKLWKFVMSDFHKLRIFYHVVEPILLNQLQNLKDSTSKEKIIVLMPGLLNTSVLGKFDQIVYLDLPLDGVQADVVNRAFIKPKEVTNVVKSIVTLREQVESW